MDDFRELVSQVHKRGMKIYIDVVTNNTADEITYAAEDTSFVPLADKPYRDVDGKLIDVVQLAGTHDFPEIDPASFPYAPISGTAKKYRSGSMTPPCTTIAASRRRLGQH